MLRGRTRLLESLSGRFMGHPARRQPAQFLMTTVTIDSGLASPLSMALRRRVASLMLVREQREPDKKRANCQEYSGEMHARVPFSTSTACHPEPAQTARDLTRAS